MPCVTNINLIFIKIFFFSLATVSDKTYFNYHMINIIIINKKKMKVSLNINFKAQYEIQV